MINNNNRRNASVAVADTAEANTEQQQPTPSTTASPPVIPLRLRARPTVRWDENVVNNEGAGRKSSKRCCIFHKQRSFGESSTDSSDNEGEDHKKVARKKGSAQKNKSKPVPDFMRYHA